MYFSSSHNRAWKFVDVIPWELIVEILSWLPVKTLMRFKCVSKSWKSLISDDKTLVKLQLERISPENKHLIFTSRPPCSFDRCFIPYPVPGLLQHPSSIMDQDSSFLRFDDEFKDADIIGSCNGLICLKISHRLCFMPCNPATGFRFDKLPPLIHDGFFSLNYGFGYDISCDTYKVVVLLHEPLDQRVCMTMVHCIGDSCWREIPSIPDSPIYFRHTNGLFVGGCVNWLALHPLVIISLDMHEETYRLLSLPEGISDLPRARAQIQVLGNCLCLFYDHKGTHFVAWKMTEYGVRESWTRLLSISYEHLQCDHRLHHWLIRLYGDGDIFMLAKDGKLAIIYNRRYRSVKYVQLPNNKHWLGANDYVESLVSPC